MDREAELARVRRALEAKRVRKAIEERKAQEAPQQGTFGESLQDFGTSAMNSLGSTAGGLNQILRDYSSIGPLLKNIQGQFGLGEEQFRAEAERRRLSQERASERSPKASFAGELAGAAAVPIPGITTGKMAKSLGSLLGLAAKEGAYQGGVGAGLQYVPEGESRTANAAFGGTIGTLLGPALAAGFNPKAIYNALRPSRLFDAGLPEAELLANQRAAQGTKTGLGQVIGSQPLQYLQENILSQLPFSGAPQTQQVLKGQIEERGADILGDLTAGQNTTGGTPGGSVLKGLREGKSNVLAESDKNYKELNRASEEESLAIGKRNFNERAMEKLEEITASDELSGDFPPDVLAKLEGYATNKKELSIKQADVFRSKLGEKAKKAGEEGERYLSGVYLALKRGREADIEDAINAKGSDKLKSLRDEAHKYYKENVGPFNDELISKFTNDFGANPDKVLGSFVKLGKNKDEAFNLEKLTGALRQSNDFPGYMAAARQGIYGMSRDKAGELNPSTLATMFRNTGNKTEEQLLQGVENPAELSQQMGDFANLVRMNPKALYPNLNPPTGNWAKALLPIATILAGAGTGGKIGAAIGGIPGAIGGAAGGAFLGSGKVAGEKLNNFLTSEASRNEFIKNIIQNRVQSGEPLNSEATQQLVKLLTRGVGAKNAKNDKPLQIGVDYDYKKDSK